MFTCWKAGQPFSNIIIDLSILALTTMILQIKQYIFLKLSTMSYYEQALGENFNEQYANQSTKLTCFNH